MAVRTINLDRMSVQEIEDLIGECLAAKQARKQETMAELRAKAQALAAESGFSLNELFGNGKSKERQRHAKWLWQHPQNPAQAWSGFGKQPWWVAELLKSGYSRDDLRKSVG